jgi:hypothetical protein
MSKVKPIPFNQYGSNISHAAAFGDSSPGPKPAGGQTTPILLSEDDSAPVALDVFKIRKMTPRIGKRWAGKAPEARNLTTKPLLLALPS